jgi:deazaflavin-dependent oxidoreductase (nitroreductase family)
MPDDTTAGRLHRVDEFEAGLRQTPLTRILRELGQTKGFATIYRRLGPRIDPWIFRRSRGRVASRLYGLPALLLTTTGRRSGLTRVSPLLYLRDGRDFAVVGTNFGQHHHPAWTANLLARPEAQIEVGAEQLPVVAMPADDATWRRLWPRFVEMYPAYQAYLERTGGRQPRMFILHPGPRA